MDNNPTPAQGSIPAQPAMQTQMQPTMNASSTPPAGNKTMIWVVLGLLLTIAIVGVVYWYLNMQQPSTSETMEDSQTAKQESNLQGDLDEIVVPEVDANFSEVDKDLGSL